MTSEHFVGNGSGWSFVGNVIWAAMFGVWLAAIAWLVGALYCLTIIGIPWGIAYFKIARISLAPLGVKIVDGDTYKLCVRRDRI